MHWADEAVFKNSSLSQTTLMLGSTTTPASANRGSPRKISCNQCGQMSQNEVRPRPSQELIWPAERLTVKAPGIRNNQLENQRVAVDGD